MFNVSNVYLPVQSVSTFFVFLFVRPSVYMYVLLSLSVCLLVFVNLLLVLCLLTCPVIVYLLHLYLCLSVCMSASLLIFSFVCVSVCLSLFVDCCFSALLLDVGQSLKIEKLFFSLIAIYFSPQIFSHSTFLLNLQLLFESCCKLKCHKFFFFNIFPF